MRDAAAPREPSAKLSVGILGPSRFGIGEPYAGGLERHTAMLARGLLDRGHDVTVYAGPAWAPRPSWVEVVPVLPQLPSRGAGVGRDTGAPRGRYETEERGYADALATAARRHDVLHNNSLHYVPALLGPTLRVPIMHAVHTPPLPAVAGAHRSARARSGHRPEIVAVSAFTAFQWGELPTRVIHNGIWPGDWSAGSGRGCYCVWSGRIVPEKAPHLAIDAARLAGRPIRLAGPVNDPVYFEEQILPRLDGDAQWLGHQGSAELAELYGSASVGVVTPVWDEPFGLSPVEMLATGTPVAAFARGALQEVLPPGTSRFARPGDVRDLATAITRAATLNRDRCRTEAVFRFSASRMVDRYERQIARLAGTGEPRLASVPAGRAREHHAPPPSPGSGSRGTRGLGTGPSRSSATAGQGR